MKHTAIKGMALGLALAAAAPMSAMAGEGSANVALTSDYLFRGASQGGAALQGGYDYDFGNGVAVGIWGSNVNLGAGPELEYDLYGSYTGKAGEMEYSLGYTYYGYTTSASSGEISLGLGYKDFGLAYYDTGYYELNYDMDVSGVGVGLHIGNGDYGLSVGKEMGGVDVSLDVVSAATIGYALTVSKSF